MSWVWWWLLFVVVFVVAPIVYGWAYRGWGPPPFRRAAPTTDAELARYDEDRPEPIPERSSWGRGAGVVWFLGGVALVWFLVAALGT